MDTGATNNTSTSSPASPGLNPTTSFAIDDGDAGEIMVEFLPMEDISEGDSESDDTSSSVGEEEEVVRVRFENTGEVVVPEREGIGNDDTRHSSESKKKARKKKKKDKKKKTGNAEHENASKSKGTLDDTLATTNSSIPVESESSGSGGAATNPSNRRNSGLGDTTHHTSNKSDPYKVPVSDASVDKDKKEEKPKRRVTGFSKTVMNDPVIDFEDTSPRESEESYGIIEIISQRRESSTGRNISFAEEPSFAQPSAAKSHNRDSAFSGEMYADGSERDSGYHSAAYKSMTKSKKFEFMSDQGDVETYTGDIYSFMALYSPLKRPQFFFFGFLVFSFQVAFLMYMILSKTSRWSENGEVDNPSDSWFGRFLPANVTSLVRWTQFTAVVSYCIFADSSLKDCATAVEYFPRYNRVRGNENYACAVISCSLRFFQGFLAIIATFLLIITEDDVIDIILNFAAVNFISTLDEAAFDLAKWGKYGPALEKEANMIEMRQIPYSIYRKYNHVRFLATVIPIAIVMVVGMAAMIVTQETDQFWVTRTLRVQFDESTGLGPYSGCYKVEDKRFSKRRIYKSFDENPAGGVFSYCKDRRQWILFKLENDDLEDPCEVERQFELAKSTKTDYFDISSSFDDTWFSASGTPLDLYFFDSSNAGTSLDENCPSFLNNGQCDAFFNGIGFQYDGGDCCASTCSQPNCGKRGASGAFGANDTLKGDGYRNCVDPDMVPVTILLNGIKSSRDPSILTVTETQINEYFLEKGIEFWEETPVTPFFNVDCDGDNVLSLYLDATMTGQTETIMVEDGAHCRVSVSNTTNFDAKWDNDPIWWVDYTVFHGNDTSNFIISGDSAIEDTIKFQRIPECYFEALEGYISVSTAYDKRKDSTWAVDWLMNDESGFSKCDNEFLSERFALGVVNFAAPIVPESLEGTIIWGTTTSELTTENSTAPPDSFENGIDYLNSITDFNEEALWIRKEQTCRWENIGCDEGSVETLAVRSESLFGIISPAVGLLTGLRRMDYDDNSLSGTIPTEIGLLTNLAGLDIDNNNIWGTIPTVLGNLKMMRELDLDDNILWGTIPTEFGLMTESREFDLRNNKLSGPIPSELGKLAYITTLGFTNNQLSGTLASGLFSKNLLQNLLLDNNNINGTIPGEIGNAINLVNIELGRNNVTGSIPTTIGLLKELRKLDLRRNSLFGSIPTEIGLLTSLTSINLRSNYFTGTIPSEVGSLTNLREIRIEGNGFTGTIPIEVTLIERLRVMTTDGNIGGSIPKDIKTRYTCSLCNGEGYERIQKNGGAGREFIYYENGKGDRIDRFTCNTLYNVTTDPGRLIATAACEILEKECLVCGGGGSGSAEEDDDDAKMQVFNNNNARTQDNNAVDSSNLTRGFLL